MGAYYNPNFLKNQPELAARVKYDLASPLSSAAMKVKLQAAGVTAMGGGQGGGLLMNQMMMQMPQMHDQQVPYFFLQNFSLFWKCQMEVTGGAFDRLTEPGAPMHRWEQCGDGA